MLTAGQIRAARALLNIGQVELAEKARVSVETIKRLEATEGALRARRETINAIRDACHEMGVRFNEGANPGIQLFDIQSALTVMLVEEIDSIVEGAVREVLDRNPDIFDLPLGEAVGTLSGTVGGRIDVEFFNKWENFLREEADMIAAFKDFVKRKKARQSAHQPSEA